MLIFDKTHILLTHTIHKKYFSLLFGDKLNLRIPSNLKNTQTYTAHAHTSTNASAHNVIIMYQNLQYATHTHTHRLHFKRIQRF